MSLDGAYLRFPTVCGDKIAFVAEDDVWLATTDGGRAWRLTADNAPVARTRLSPDGTAVAFTSRRDGPPDVHVVGVDGGTPRRLTYWGDDTTRVLGWTDDGRVLAATAAGQPFRSRIWAYVVPLDGGPAQRLPYGPVSAIARGPGGATVLGVHQNRRGAASWKRYRGGMAGVLWIDRTGEGRFERLLADVAGQLEDPGWMGERVVLLSDHEGWGNVYSCRPDGRDLRRHSDHGDAYARAAHTDGRTLVYQCLGELWLVDDLVEDSSPRRLDVRLGGPRTARSPRPIDACWSVGDVAPDHAGRASAVEVRGTVHWLTHRDGPARLLAGTPGVRARLPQVLGRPSTPADGEGGGAAGTGSGGSGSGSGGAAAGAVAAAGGGDEPVRVAWVTDAEGDDAIEVGTVGGPGPRRLAAGRIGRVLELVAAPDGSVLAVASHDGRVLLVDVEGGDVTQVDHSEHGDASGLSFSPDGRWLAWSRPGGGHLRQIRMARVDTQGSFPLVDATPLRFVDTEPVFTLDGKHLAFLSARTFDPVYDEHVFDLAFPTAVRPHLLPLAATTPSPFDPELHGRAVGGQGGDGDGGGAGAPGGSGEPPEVVVDVEGMDQRVVPLPVPAGRYYGLRAARDGLLWLRAPLVGVLGAAQGPGESNRPRLQRYDLRSRRLVTLVDTADDATVSGDGRWVVYRDGGDVRVAPADRRVDGSDDDSESTVDVDLTRLRVVVHPADEWRQMYDEAGRLMRDHFWVADMSGVDWDGVLARYRPLLDRIGSRDDLSELLWEVQGELGTSHAYEFAPDGPVEHIRRVGRLGADIERDGDGNWRIVRMVPGESSAPAARSPLLAPGVALRPGDAVVAVDGRPVDPVTGPAPLLVGAAGVPVELTVRRDADADADADGSGGGGGGGGGERRVVVEPLYDEMPLRYHDWVAGRRAAVHAASGGRVGYLHIPDMMAEGWAQLHRDLHLEVDRDALVVDVRDNSGGHLSELVLEKLARTVRGWCMVRHKSPRTYPENAVRGPVVAVTNEVAGSDGDIVTAGFRALGLGPIVGMRTWGGVIGIDSRYHLVDGTVVTQPRYSHHFEGFGWGIENHGVDPDVEVPFAPHDWGAGTDPQLDTAVRLALRALGERPPSTPPDLATRPDRRAPVLPPRSVRP